MNFGHSFARALVPVAILPRRFPAAAAELCRPRQAEGAHRRGPDDDRQISSRPTRAGARPPARCSSSGRARSVSSTAAATCFWWRTARTLTFLDYQVGQKSSWPLSRTPLGPLLSSSPDFNGKAQILPSSDPRVVVARATQYLATGS